MARIPNECPACGSYQQWQEVIDPYTSGIPLSIFLPFSFAKHIRFRPFSMSGGLSHPVREKLGVNKVRWRCKACGFAGIYDLHG